MDHAEDTSTLDGEERAERGRKLRQERESNRQSRAASGDLRAYSLGEWFEISFKIWLVNIVIGAIVGPVLWVALVVATTLILAGAVSAGAQ